MSNLFKYLYNQTNNNDTIKCVDERINKNINNTLCNNLYGDYIDKAPHPFDSSFTQYRKQVFYEKSSPEVLWFDDQHDCIVAEYYQNNNAIISFLYHKKSLYVNNIRYKNFANYTYLNIYIFEDIYCSGIPYNIEGHSSKTNKYIFINTKTKQYEIIN